MTIQRRLLLQWVILAWSVLHLLDSCAWLPSQYEVSRAGSLPSTVPPAVQDAGGPLSTPHSENLLEHAAGDAASAAHLRQFVDAEQRLSGRSLVAGNCVTLLVDGSATYQAMFDAMRTATDHIHLEIYELADDQIGQALADLVLERHAAGVHVKILYDSLGSRGSSAAYFEHRSQLKGLPK